ncbi:MAG: hypothetical protein ACHQYP_11360 [Nitrospiria bacterium]
MFYSYLIFILAQDIANETPGFFITKGPGIGNQATNAFMSELQKRGKEKIGFDCCEKRICGDTLFAVDFYFPKEGTIIEIALSLNNPNREFEKDIIKAILAKRAGNSVKKLVFISKPGAIERNEEPGPKAIISWIEQDYGIKVYIRELQDLQQK